MGASRSTGWPLFLWSSIVIFVTVGSQLPFDRLIKAVDQWAAWHSSSAIFAQIGLSNYQPQYFEFCHSMTPAQYQKYLKQADLIISHAGIGTIISALELGKPLLLLPRLDNGIECRNDHQFSTVKHFAHFPNITVINNETELAAILDKKLLHNEVYDNLKTEVSPSLINVIEEFINFNN